MNDRFELSFKNKVVRKWVVIMVLNIIAGGLNMLSMKAKANIIIGSFPLMAWIFFLIWRYLYRRKQERIFYYLMLVRRFILKGLVSYLFCCKKKR